jgi:DNA modification methylase
MKIKSVPIDQVKPYERNPRNNAGAIEKVASSLREFGWQQPIVVDKEFVVIAGHTRLAAAKSLGMDHVPVLVASDLSPEQVKAFRITDNRVGEEAEWNFDLLKLELEELRLGEFDLSLIGFDTAELAGIMLATEGESDPETVPDAPVVPVTRRGDVWLLGRHRFVCGDSTNADDVAKALKGVKPHLMVTDPPYGVEYDPDWRNKAARNSPGMGNRHIGAGAVGIVHNDDRADWTEAYDLFPGDVAYVWHADRHASAVQSSLEASKFEIRCQLIWAKQQFAIGRGDYHWKHEPCWYAVRKGRNGHWNGDRKQTTVWEIDKPQKSETGHSTQKPIECMRRPIENNSKPGDAVYEPFSGSGTTIIAAEMTGRVCHALELSPEYCDVAVKRWQEFTKKKARLERTGLAFDEVAAERLSG